MNDGDGLYQHHCTQRRTVHRHWCALQCWEWVKPNVTPECRSRANVSSKDVCLRTVLYFKCKITRAGHIAETNENETNLSPSTSLVTAQHFWSHAAEKLFGSKKSPPVWRQTCHINCFTKGTFLCGSIRHTHRSNI